MARLRRGHPAVRGRALLIRGLPLLLAVGCANPISNRVFYADAEFLAALPSAERYYAPRDVRFARVGTSPVLEQAVLAAAELEEHAALVAISGDALRSAVPDARSEVLRSWSSSSAAARIDGASHVWFVRGSVVQPDEEDLEWTIEVSSDGEEPWHPIGSGSHDPDGTGEAAWDLTTHAEALGLDVAPGVVEIEYDDLGSTGTEPLVEYVIEGLALPRIWAVAGQAMLVWTDTFALTDNGASWPGVGQAVHVPDQGGWAVGALYVGDDELGWEACWDVNGDELWRGGDAGITSVGAPDACPFANPLTAR